MQTRIKEKGKPSKVILIAILNKILRIAFALVQMREMYRSDFVENTARKFLISKYLF